MKKNKKIKSYFELKEVIAICFAFIVITSSVTGYIVYLVASGKYENSSSLNDIITSYNKIKNDYYENLDEEKLSSAAIAGMMDYLDESYSEYLDGNSTDSLNDKLNGSYKGIGVKILSKDDTITIYEVFEDSPALDAGIEVGDILIEVNDKKVSEMTLSEITSEIQESKNKVKFKIKRKDKELDVEVDVKTLDTPVTNARIVDEEKNIGYIGLSNFSDTSYKQFSKSLSNLEEQKISSLIIDLRDNTGGYLKEAENIASLFLKKGKTIYYLDSKKKLEEISDKTKDERTYPVVVLVNQITASASEILASSLKESYGAILVGEKTFGKGKVQQTSKLSDNQSIKYTTAKWYTPSKVCIDGVGLTPGIQVKLDKKYYDNPILENDNQLLKAINFLKNN